MNVQELHVRLQELIDEGKGEYEVVDTNAFPIISAVYSEADEVADLPEGENLRRVYIEAEF